MKEPGNDGQDYSNFSNNETFDSIIRQRFSRRSILKGAAAAAPLLILGGGAVPGSLKPAEAAAPLGFTPIAANRDDKVTVPAGYTANYLIGWGDPMFPGVDKLAWVRQNSTKLQGSRKCASATTRTSSATTRCRTALTAPRTASSS